MAFDTYTALQASILNYLARPDLTAVVPDWITLAEATLNSSLRHRRMVVTSAIIVPINIDRVALPADLLDIAYILRTTDFTKPLIRRTPTEIAELQRVRLAVASEPVYYCISGMNMIVTPIPDGSKTYNMDYYQRIPPLAQYGTNWLLQYYPDLYLYTSLLHAAPYMADDALEASMKARVEALVQIANADQGSLLESET